MAKKVKVKITSAVSIDGKIITPGETPELDEAIAKNLFHRKKAELATDETAEGLDDIPLDEMTVPQLKVVAKTLNIEGFGGMNKAALIEAIEKAEDEVVNE